MQLYATHGIPNFPWMGSDIVEVGINLPGGVDVVVTAQCLYGDTAVYDLLLTIVGLAHGCSAAANVAGGNVDSIGDAGMTIGELGWKRVPPFFYAAIRPRISCKPCSASSMRPSSR